MTDVGFSADFVADSADMDQAHPEPRQLRTSEASIAERYLWLDAMVNHIPDFIYAKDLDGRFLYANRAIIERNGLTCLEDIVGLTDVDLHGKAAEDARIAEIEQRVVLTGEPDIGFDERALTGGDQWLMMSRVPLRNANGKIIGVVGTSRDISARKASERIVLAQNRILELIAASVSIALLTKELAELIEGLAEGIRCAMVTFSSENEVSAWEAPSASMLPKTLLEALHSGSPDCIQETMLGLENELDKFHCFEIPSVSAGHRGVIAVWAVQVHLDESLVRFLLGASRMVGIAIDRRQAEEQIRFLVEHDALTGMMNRSAIEARLLEVLTSSDLTAKKLTVGFIDVDNFKQVNDTLGHAAGDELLKAIAERLTKTVGVNDMVARIGGDEFIVVLLGGHECFKDTFQRIRIAIAQPVTIEGMEIRTSCSIGAASFPDHGKTTSDLFKAADLAMYRAKENGRNNIQTFSPDLRDAARHKFLRIKELKHAIHCNEFVLHYQPQIDLATGRISGVEALVRWMHPTDGLLAPSEFIPIAEESGLILELGEIVLQKACEQAARWRDAKRPLRVSVNVSPKQFQNASLIPQVVAALSANGLDPALLEIEVTESSIIQDVDAAIDMMKELAEMGVTLAIDDFGTGYSCLGMLKIMPLSRLKIDRSFVTGTPDFERDRTIVSTIITLAKSLGLKVVAEGVEYEDQARFLRDAGCEYAQGYFYGRPVEAQELDIWWADR